MALLYGRAGRLTAKNDGFRPGQSQNFIWHFDFFKFFTNAGSWREAYAHDAAGLPISGCLELLAAASGQGCEVTISLLFWL